MRSILFMLLLFASGSPGQAGILYTSIDPIQPPGSAFSNDNGRGMVSYAYNAFTPTSTGQLETILAALNYSTVITPAAVTLQMNLYSDCCNAPGTLLESLSIPSQDIPGQIVAFPSTAHSTLIAGEMYWLSIMPLDGQGSVLNASSPGTWYSNTAGIFAPVAAPIGTFWSSQVALTVYDAPGGEVPEPATVLLLAGGMLALAGFGRRLRFTR